MTGPAQDASGAEMPREAIPAWDAYSEAVRELARAERDDSTSSAERASLALVVHRYWRAWCAAMDESRAAKLSVINGGRFIDRGAWDALVADVQVARIAIEGFDAAHPDWEKRSDEEDAKSEELEDARDRAEERLFDHPSPDAAGFAFKFLIAYGAGREANAYHEILEREAQRFAQAIPVGHERVDQSAGRNAA